MTPIEEAAKAGNAAYQKAAYDIDVDWDGEVSEDEKRLAIIFARAVLRALAAMLANSPSKPLEEIADKLHGQKTGSMKILMDAADVVLVSASEGEAKP